MTASESDTAEVTGALAVLATHQPDQDRAVRVRVRCLSALRTQQHRPRFAAMRTPPAGWIRALEPAVVGALCAVYLVEVLSRALHLHRF